MRLPQDWFERYTFREFAALAKRRRKEQRQQASGHAMTCATLANINRGKQAKRWNVSDFLGPEET